MCLQIHGIAEITRKTTAAIHRQICSTTAIVTDTPRGELSPELSTSILPTAGAVNANRIHVRPESLVPTLVVRSRIPNNRVRSTDRLTGIGKRIPPFGTVHLHRINAPPVGGE